MPVIYYPETQSYTLHVLNTLCRNRSFILNFLYVLCRNPVLRVESSVCSVQKSSPICCISCMLCADTQSYVLNLLYAVCRNPVLSVAFPVCFVQKPSPTCWIFCTVQKPSPICCISCMLCAETQSYVLDLLYACLLYTSPSPRDSGISRMPSSA